MQRPTWIKICGVTLPEDIELLTDAGVDAVGLNFIRRSKRRVDVPVARRLAEVAKGRVELVGVVADLDQRTIRELIEVVGLDSVQLHGNEPDALLESLGPIAYRAVGIASAIDVQRANAVPGARVLLDTKVGDIVGGTGATFDWDLVQELAASRDVIVAGGLHPGNVGAAVALLRPYGIDVASGVELAGCPGRKDAAKLEAFVEEIRRAERR